MIKEMHTGAREECAHCIRAHTCEPEPFSESLLLPAKLVADIDLHAHHTHISHNKHASTHTHPHTHTHPCLLQPRNSTK